MDALPTLVVPDPRSSAGSAAFGPRLGSFRAGARDKGPNGPYMPWSASCFVGSILVEKAQDKRDFRNSI